MKEKLFRNFTGIRRRWMINSVAMMIFVTIMGVVALSASAASYYYNSVRTGLQAQARTATEFFSTYINQSYEEFYESAKVYTESFDKRDTIELQFISTSGRIIVSTYGLTAGGSPATGDISDAVETKEISVWQGRNPSTGEMIMAVSSPMLHVNGRVIGVMRYVTSLKLVNRQIVKFTLFVLAIGVGILSLIVFSNSSLMNSIIVPLRDVNYIAKKIAEGGYGVQIQKKYNDEIGELTDTINDMSLKISQAEKMQSEFISSVSHELRTPLTAITGWAETMTYDSEMSAESREGVRIILRETRRLTQMVEELLEFTRIQDGRFSLRIEKMDVETELEESIDTYREVMKQNGIELDYSPTDDDIPLIEGDPERLRQVFLNIIDNAIKYGRDGKRLSANMTMDGAYVSVSIRDYGPGIPPDELPRVKLKFYKGSSKERGSGIGLAVCDEIVRLHGGELTVANADGGGTVVTVRLPVTPFSDNPQISA